MINEAGMNLIRTSEGLRLKAYQDSGGVWTIGYGHTSDEKLKVVQGLTISKEQAEELLQYDVQQAEQILRREYPAYTKLNENQYAALVDFIFNRGSLKLIVGGRAQDTTLLKHLKAGNYGKAAEQFSQWVYDSKKNKLTGLMVRRSKETLLFNTPIKGSL